MAIPIVTTRADLRGDLGDGTPGFVPTMGALHAGHQALIARAAAENATTVVSIFVNPTQFSDPGDLAAYPRDLAADRDRAASAGATLIFAPPVAEIYPSGAATTVEPGPLATPWEGAARPGHFTGVATVVTILLNLVHPAQAYFGEKDYQQLRIVQRLHRDLALPGEIIGVPTIRELDGLALSSRNRRLSPAGRALAGAIPAALSAMAARAATGTLDVTALLRAGADRLVVPGITLDYLAVVDGDELTSLAELRPGARALVAAVVEGVRLIDNLPLIPPQP